MARRIIPWGLSFWLTKMALEMNIQRKPFFENFIHEVLHCICHTYNGEIQIEEREICALSHGWYQVLVDNFGEVDERENI